MFKPDPRCKICTLPEDVIKIIHYARFVEGKTLPQICKLLDEQVGKCGLDVGKFYPASVSRHFQKHVDPKLVSTYLTQAAPAVRRVTSVSHQKIKNVDDHLAAIVAPENLELFERLRDIIDHVTEHTEIIELALPTKKDIEDCTKEGDKLAKIMLAEEAYTPYIKMIKELRATIETSAKFLNLKNVLRRFVEDLLQEYTQKVTEAFLEEMRYMQQELFVDDPVSSSLMREVATDFANKLAGATNAVVDKFERILASEKV